MSGALHVYVQYFLIKKYAYLIPDRKCLQHSHNAILYWNICKRSVKSLYCALIDRVSMGMQNQCVVGKFMICRIFAVKKFAKNVYSENSVTAFAKLVCVRESPLTFVSG